MGNKTEVKRLTKRENEVVSAIREVGIDNIIEGLGDVLNKEGVDNETLRKFKNLIRLDYNLTLDDLVEQGTISKMDAACLEKAMLEGDNIVVVGKAGTGKTVLAKALANLVSENGLFIIDKFGDYNNFQRGAMIVEGGIEGVSLESLSNSTFGDVSRVIVGEVTTSNEALATILALSNKKSVLFTGNIKEGYTEKSIKDFLVHECNSIYRSTAKLHLEREKFIITETSFDKETMKRSIKIVNN